ncbi:MAG: glycosyltransferase family 2 protein [Paracoccaceae bacterium]
MSLFDSYRLRLRRKRSHLRARLRRRDLTAFSDRTRSIRSDDILLFSVLRNERVRLSYFLSYYRDLGVDHFLFVDNGSSDGSREYLATQPDCSVWTTASSYRRSHYGVDWLNGLQRRHGHGHWTLVVDADEFFVYPFCDTRPLRALTDWLDTTEVRSFSAMLLDMYPKGRITDRPYRDGQNPFEIACFFDPGNYSISRNHRFGNLWIQGGPRARAFFADNPRAAPALNKVPLVKWHSNYAYDSSTHILLPRGLNIVYDRAAGEKASGCLLHAKFLDVFVAKTEEEGQRQEHYAGSREYAAYRAELGNTPELWCKWSEKYINWRQLEILGLMSKGNWA